MFSSPPKTRGRSYHDPNFTGGSEGKVNMHPSKAFLTEASRLSTAFFPCLGPDSHAHIPGSLLAHNYAENEQIPEIGKLLLYQSVTRHCSEAFLCLKHQIHPDTEPGSPRIPVALCLLDTADPCKLRSGEHSTRRAQAAVNVP